MTSPDFFSDALPLCVRRQAARLLAMLTADPEGARAVRKGARACARAALPERKGSPAGCKEEPGVWGLCHSCHGAPSGFMGCLVPPRAGSE